MKFIPVRKHRMLRKGEKGQTILLAVISLIIILLALLVIFDVHNMIRGKVKSQTAVDSAALTGANWQKYSLNLIGELNLVKATTILFQNELLGLSGTKPEDFTLVPQPSQINGKQELLQILEQVENQKQMFQTAIGLLSQMQTRISFVGPLVGFGAAQQAAKNNGLTSNHEIGEILYGVWENIGNDDLYGNEKLAPQIINGYAWREPYRNMFRSLLGNVSSVTRQDGNITRQQNTADGLAVSSNVTALGLPNISAKDGQKSRLFQFLLTRRFYDAILANSWCELMDALDASEDMDMSGNWWGTFTCDYNTQFMEESELLPLHIDFFEGENPYLTVEQKKIFDRISGKRSWPDNYIERSGFYFNDAGNPYPYVVDNSGNIKIQTQFDQNGHPIPDARSTNFRYNLIPYINWAIFDSTWEAYSDDFMNYWRPFLRGNFWGGYQYFSGALSPFKMKQQTKTITGSTGAANSFRNMNGKGGLGRQMSDSARHASSMGSSMQNNISLGASATAKVFGRIQKEDGSYLPPFGAGGMILPVFTHSELIPVALETASGTDTLDLAWFYFISEFLPILGQSSSIDRAITAYAAQDTKGHRALLGDFYQALRKLDDPEWRKRGLTWLNKELAGYDDPKTGKRISTKLQRDTCDDWPTNGGGGGRWGPGVLH